jgi:hypothetical protein
MSITEIDWSAIEGRAAKDIEVAIKAPPGLWYGNIASTKYQVRVVDGVKDPTKKYEFREVLFEVLPDTMLEGTGDDEKAAKMSELDKAESRKWKVIELRRRSDIEVLREFLREIKCYNEKLPLFSQGTEKTCLDLVGADNYFPPVLFEIAPARDKDGNPTTKLGSVRYEERKSNTT